jgi:hypothetical protein
MFIIDESLLQDVLSGFILSVPSLELVAICPEAIEATRILQETYIDILILNMIRIGNTDWQQIVIV